MANPQETGDRANAWLADNLPALESSNEHVAQHGLPLAKYSSTAGMHDEPIRPAVGFEVLAISCRQALLGLKDRPGSQR